MRRSCYLALAVIWVLAFSASDAQQSSVIAIRAGHLIDPATGGVATDQIVLIREGKIVEVGPKVPIPPGAAVRDLTSSWVMPGLLDAHTHLTTGVQPGRGLFDHYVQESSALRALRGARNARIVLNAGFTTVRDVGNDANYTAADLRRAISQGWIDGPTILTSGKIIAPFGGQSTGFSVEQGPFWRYEYIDADTADEIIKAVRQNLYYGADLIKLVSDDQRYYYSEADIRAAVTESHNAGVAVAVHVAAENPERGVLAASNVILGGADSIEHGFYLTDDLLRLMKEKGTVLVGTDFPEAHLKSMFPATDGDQGRASKTASAIADRLRRAHDIGVTMAFGTDVILELSERTRADLMLDYLDVWLAAKVSPPAILKAMTTNAARLLRIEKQRGAIAPGLAADIIATLANPFDDIRALRKVNFVMKDGRVIKAQ